MVEYSLNNRILMIFAGLVIFKDNFLIGSGYEYI